MAGGYSYREIRERTGMSLGAINQLVADIRGKVPDADRLRELNLVLSKGGSTVYDAMRGGMLLSELNKLGVGLDELEGFIKLSTQISSEKGAETEEFVNSALKLTNLERETGKTYEGIVKDFEGKVLEVKRLDEEKGELQKGLRGLREELTKTEKALSSKVQELKSALETDERLRKLGLNRASALAEFIGDYEALGFSAQEVQRLAEWRKSLAEMGIDPDKLGEYIKEGDSFERRLKAMEEKMKSEEARLKMLTKMEGDLRRRVDDIKRVDSLLQQRYQSFVCAYCGAATPHEIRRFEIQSAMTMGQPLYVACVRCGATNTYDPRTILLGLGLEILS
ncbi:MAG: hypothetical protein QW231_03755 [Candidatus Bathyarchaeia archaeon]